MVRRLFFLVIACLTFMRCISVQWATAPEDRAVIYACANGSLSLPWILMLSPGDIIENVQWFFSGRSNELIATEARGHLFTLPAFSGRVSQSTNAGIDLKYMQNLDAGNYSVEVLVRQASGDIVTLWRSAFVHVTDQHIIGGQLRVNQLPVAEHNNQTDQYHLVLSCGNFTYTTQPPFLATWLTPSGRSLDSDKYDNNQFFLRLPNPVEGGSYICRVSSPSACLSANSSVEGTVTVDRLEARLAVLEAQQVALIDTLKAKPDNLQKAVSFHAVLTNETDTMPRNSTLVFDRVVTNVGNGYNASSGVFTAPYDGTYFFVASGEENSGRHFYIGLVADNTLLHRVDTYGSLNDQSGSVHGVVYLTAGQTASVKILTPDLNELLGNNYTAFSGFLIHP